MKNRIWVGKDKDGDQFNCTEKMTLWANGLFCDDDGKMREADRDPEFNCDDTDFFGLNLKPLEIVEIIIDTETQKYEVKRPREIGWYLTVCENSYIDSTVVARYWNGTEWKIKIGSAKWAGDDIIKVVSEKLDNEYLKSLE